MLSMCVVNAFCILRVSGKVGMPCFCKMASSSLSMFPMQSHRLHGCSSQQEGFRFLDRVCFRCCITWAVIAAWGLVGCWCIQLTKIVVSFMERARYAGIAATQLFSRCSARSGCSVFFIFCGRFCWHLGHCSCGDGFVLKTSAGNPRWG